jgi:hypothetical protein
MDVIRDPTPQEQSIINPYPDLGESEKLTKSKY